MKAIYKSLLAAAAVTPLLTGCIEEALPTSGIVQSQLEASPEATSALLWAMPGHMLNTLTMGSSSYHFDWGYPSMMHIRDVMTDDMVVDYGGGYDWFASWSQNDYVLGENYLICQYPWNFFYEQVLTTNSLIGAIRRDTEDATAKYNLGAGLAYRALTYLDIARMYEVLPNSAQDGYSNDGKYIVGLTAPIITETTSEEQVRKNPRASHDEMFNFIMTDLQDAEKYMSEGTAAPNKTLPSLTAVYGLMARAYLWDASYYDEAYHGNNGPVGGEEETQSRSESEAFPPAAPAWSADPARATANYKKAAEYARKAIGRAGSPMTKDQWLSTTTGFNTIESSWILAMQYVSESAAVKTSLLNWTSFLSNEAQFGYAGAGAWVSIGAQYYNRINDRDFRKLAFVAPESSKLAGQESYVDDSFAENFSSYYSLKFRPGAGGAEDAATGAVVAIPLMRVEEMYFIEAEATAQVNPAEGNNLLNKFMQTYRYPTYKNLASTKEEIIDEIIFQKRIELWGEGLNFFDVKRLNLPVTRYYSDTNFEIGFNTFNTPDRPSWMNFVIVRQELDNNIGIQGMNTPSPYQNYPLIN